MCKTEYGNVYVVRPHIHDFAQVRKEDYRVFDAPTKMHAQTDSDIIAAKKVMNTNCSVCGWKGNSKPALVRHLRESHKLELCKLCCDNQLLFVSEQKAMKSDALRTHTEETHPRCRFCRRDYYNNDALFEHLKRDHYSCGICQKNGVMYEFYADTPNLVAHQRREHFVCDDVDCQLTAFETAFELEVHRRSVHENGGGGGGVRGKGKKREMRIDAHLLFGDGGGVGVGNSGGASGGGGGSERGRRKGGGKRGEREGGRGGRRSRRGEEEGREEEGVDGGSERRSISALHEDALERASVGGRRRQQGGSSANSRTVADSSRGMSRVEENSAERGAIVTVVEGRRGEEEEGRRGDSAKMERQERREVREEGISREEEEKGRKEREKEKQEQQQEEMKRRNRQLVERIRTCLDGDEQLFSRFRLLATHYRLDEINADEYCLRVVDLLGRDADSIMPELISLLPDMTKRTSLFTAYQSYKKEKASDRTSPSSSSFSTVPSLVPSSSSLLPTSSVPTTFTSTSTTSHLVASHPSLPTFPPFTSTYTGGDEREVEVEGRVELGQREEEIDRVNSGESDKGRGRGRGRGRGGSRGRGRGRSDVMRVEEEREGRSDSADMRESMANISMSPPLRTFVPASTPAHASTSTTAFPAPAVAGTSPTSHVSVDGSGEERSGGAGSMTSIGQSESGEAEKGLSTFERRRMRRQRNQA